VTRPWWAGLPAAEARLDCGGQPHRLRWAAGELTAPDHTDLAGEQILSALAGQGFPCLDVLDLWARHAADLRALILASRGPADPLATWTPPAWQTGWQARGRIGRPRRMARHGRRASYAMLSHGPPDDPDEDLLRLIGLGGLLLDRLAATVIAAWAERLRGPADAGAVASGGAGVASADAGALDAARPALHAALYGRAVTALRSWTGRRDLPVALTMVPEDQPARLARDGDGDGIAAELPFGWLADVWARGLTICWGRFCLAAAPQPSGDGWVLSTVALDLGPPTPVTLGNPPPS
jgi:hypothetical protein